MIAEWVCVITLWGGGALPAQVQDPAQVHEIEAPQAEVPEGGPRIECPNPTLDLGKIMQGETASGTFTIKNVGDAELKIDRVRASCGCTTVQLTEEQKTIAPGEQVEVTAKFDSTGRQGKQKKYVTVTSNDARNNNLRLTLECDVEALLNVNPLRLNVRDIRPGDAIEQAVDVTPGGGEKSLELLAVDVRGEGIRYTSEPLSDDERSGVRLRFVIDEGAPTGQLNASANIRAKVGDREAAQLLRIFGNVTGDLTFIPNMVQSPIPIARGQSLQKVIVRSSDQKTFEILEAKAGDRFQCDVKETRAGLQYEVQLAVADSAPDGPTGAFLDIKTTSVLQPLIRIPVFVNVAPAVSVSPPLVLLKSNGDAGAGSRKVALSTSRGTPLAVSNVSCENSFVKAELVEESAGASPSRKYVRIGLNGDVPPGTHEAVVVVHTDVKEAEELRVPVTVLGPSATAASAD